MTLSKCFIQIGSYWCQIYKMLIVSLLYVRQNETYERIKKNCMTCQLLGLDHEISSI